MVATSAGCARLPLAATGVLLLFGLVEIGYALTTPWPAAVMRDLNIYTQATERLFSGGSWYLDRQLGGPYPILGGDVLYPPVTALFFAFWLVLPFPIYLATPIVVTAWLIRSWAPSVWTWPMIALGIVWPFTLLKTTSGNPNVWVMMVIALGLRYRWPGALILLKPSFFPFLLIGIRTRGWWIAAALIAGLSLLFLAPTLAYPRVILDSRGDGLLYSLIDLPIVAIPVVAWLGRTRLRGSQATTTAAR